MIRSSLSRGKVNACNTLIHVVFHFNILEGKQGLVINGGLNSQSEKAEFLPFDTTKKLCIFPTHTQELIFF